MIRPLRYLSDVRKRMLEDKVRRSKDARASQDCSYCESPQVSLILQSFNHRDNIRVSAERLRRLPYHELIVCEDGSVDGSLESWLRVLDRPNDFLIRSNDLHEIRT